MTHGMGRIVEVDGNRKRCNSKKKRTTTRLGGTRDDAKSAFAQYATIMCGVWKLGRIRLG